MVSRFILVLLMLTMSTVHAAQISVSTDRNPVAPDETFKLFFKVEGSQDGEPDFSPLNNDFQLLGTSQSSSFSMVNGQTSSSRTYTLTVLPLKKGTLTIPAISFGRDKSTPVTVKVESQGYRPRPGDPANSSQTADSQLFFVTAETNTLTPYVQQQVILTVKVYQRTRWADAGLTDPRFEGVETMFQPLGKERKYKTQHQGKNYTVTELRYALFPQQSGDLTIMPLRLTAKIPTGNRKNNTQPGGFNDPFLDSFFTQQSYATKIARSEAIKLNVRSIPATFTGNHWLVADDIQLTENWSADPGDVQAGEPITRTIALIGDGVGSGQLPEIALPETDGIKIYPDQPETREQLTTNGLLTSRSHKFALIPSSGGKLTLPEIEIPWWNSKTDQMEVARIEPVTIKVQANEVLAQAEPQTATPAQQPVTPSTTEPTDQINQDKPFWHLPGDINTWLIVTSIVLWLLWTITLIAWWRARKAPAKNQTEQVITQPEHDLESIKRELKLACKHNNPQEIRDACLKWARALWSHNPPNSLEAIASRVDSPLSGELSALSASLYGAKESSWDAAVISKEAVKLTPTYATETPKDNETLEPMYR